MCTAHSRWAAAATFVAAVASIVHGQDPGSRPSLEQRFADMQERYEHRIKALEDEVKDLKARPQGGEEADAATALDRAIAEVKLPDSAPARVAGGQGASPLKLIDISLDLLFAAGTSSETDEGLQTLQGGGHDPKKRGFTVQNAELSFQGVIDPYFTGDAHIVYQIDPLTGETGVELEEIFLTTTSLPAGLQIEAGQSFLEFGRINPRHPHQWEWQDAPIINSRVFGPDGMRCAGVRVGWLTPLPWFSELHAGVYNPNGETMTSFFATEEGGIGGRPFVDQGVRGFDDLVYLLRTDNSFDLSDEITVKVGASTAFGPNATGPGGYTWIYGGDLLMKWRPTSNFRGWPFVNWQSEVIFRNYSADGFSDIGDPLDPTDDVLLPSDTLDDWGFYTQVLYGFTHGWAVGLRGEYVSANGRSFDPILGAFIDTADDPFRDDRYRLSAMVLWEPSEFSRLRLQYNYDNAQHISGGDAHSLWLGVEFLFGTHPAHTY